MVTGESMPVEKQTGDQVIGGTVNQTGSFVMRAEKVGRGHGTGADRADGGGGAAQPRAHPAAGRSGVGLVRAARDRGRAYVRGLGDLWAAAALAYALVSAVAVLIIACPCALGSRHTDVDHGRHRARREGRRAHQERRGAGALEKVDTLVVDKTGTLTEGKPRVIAVRTAAGHAEDDVLRLAASLERGSEHPLGAAILRRRRQRGLPLAAVQDFDAPVGKGVTGSVDGRRVVIGNARILKEAGIEVGALAAEAEQLAQEGATVDLRGDRGEAGRSDRRSPTPSRAPRRTRWRR